MTEKQDKSANQNFPLNVDISNCLIKSIGAKSQSWLVMTHEGNPVCVLKTAESFTDINVAECLMKIQHAGLPRCYGKVYIEDLQLDCYVFEYLPGTELKQVIGNDHTAELLHAIAIKICRLLSFLRCKPDFEIWHLDLKPENIIVNDKFEPALIDFASACMASSCADKRSGQSKCDAILLNESEKEDIIAGSPDIYRQFSCTPGYAAPEMLLGRPHRSSDLYSLAVTFLVVFSKDYTNSGRTISEVIKSVTPEIAAALSDYLQSDPILRPQRPEQLAFGLNQVLMAPAQKTLFIPVKQKCETTDVHVQTINEGSTAPVICFWNSAEMACEAASFIAGCGPRVLLIDSEWLDSRTDLLLGIRNIARSGIRNALAGNLDNALSAAFEDQLDESRLQDLIQTTQVDNLYLIAPSGNYEIYEDDLSSAYCRLIEAARGCFDFIIISAGSHFYDELACLSLSFSDHVISAIRGFNESIRAQGRALTFLCHKQIVSRDKISFAVFDYKISSDLSRGTISQLCNHQLIGCISENQQRRKQKCTPLPYAARLSRQNAREYKAMLSRLEPGRRILSKRG